MPPYLPSLLIALAIGYLSFATGDGLPKVSFRIPYADKWVHMGMYLALAAALVFDLSRSGKIVKSLLVISLSAIAIAALYGGVIELLQPYFPPRTCELADWLADLTGATVGATLLSIWIRRNSFIP